MEVRGYYCSALDILTIKSLYLATKTTFYDSYMALSVLLAAILAF